MGLSANRPLAFVVAAVALLFAGVNGESRERPQVSQVLSTSKTVMDEPIVYPSGKPAKITTAIVTMAPGVETGWHTHGVPLTGLILEGELTVDYGEKGKRTFRQGESVAEAINVPHNGKNTGAGVLRFFVVYMGAEGAPNSLPIGKE